MTRAPNAEANNSGSDARRPRLRRPSTPILQLFIGAFVFCLFGLFLFPWGIWNARRLEEMAVWPTAEAEVVAADTAFRYRRFGLSAYVHEIRYRFAVEGLAYEGDRVSYGGEPPSWPAQDEAVARLPEIGSMISIRYNPEKPGDSVIYILRDSPEKTRGLLWFVGIVGLAGGAAMAAAARALLKKR